MNMKDNQLLNLSFIQVIRASLGLSFVALCLCGFGYSSMMTRVGQLVFPQQANGSLIEVNGTVLGSSLVAQPFTQEKYFHPRPSASHYDPMLMAGRNMAQTNPELQQIVKTRQQEISAQEHITLDQVPSDLITASGSGIDPEISVQSAMIQVKRVAKERQLSEQDVVKLINEHRIQPTLGFLGAARINVLELNLAMDKMNSLR